MHLVIFSQLTYLINLDLNLVLLVRSLLALKTILIQQLLPLHLAVILHHFQLLSLGLESLILSHSMGHQRQWFLHHGAHRHSVIIGGKHDPLLRILHDLTVLLLLLVLILHLPKFARDTLHIARLLPVQLVPNRLVNALCADRLLLGHLGHHPFLLTEGGGLGGLAPRYETVVWCHCRRWLLNVDAERAPHVIIRDSNRLLLLLHFLIVAWIENLLKTFMHLS